MSTDTPGCFEERIEAAVREAVAAGELGPDTSGMTGPWVLVAVTYDSSGQRGMSAGDRAHRLSGGGPRVGDGR